MMNATWDDFAAAEPAMAGLFRGMLDWIPIAYIASVRRGGSPRVHPFCPIFARGRMFIAVPTYSPKRWDLRRDGRFAMHALPGKRDDEFYMTGRARLLEDDLETRKAVVDSAGHTVHDDDWVFELAPEYVMTAYWEKIGQAETYPVRREWRPAKSGRRAVAAGKRAP
jgi:hypothetical protein